MKISIITITYNSVDTLKDAIESVLHQSYSNIEYIVVDGGSKDETVSVLTQYGTRINWVSEPDNGIYNALNKGIAMASGQYIGFLHADDLLADNEVVSEIAASLAEHHPDVIFGDLEYVNKDNISKIIRYWKSDEFSPYLLKKGWMPPHPTLYVKKEWYQILGGFDESFHIAADYDFILRIFSQTGLKAIYLNRLVVKMRIGGASNRSLKNIIIKMKEDYKALRRNHVGGFGSLICKNFSKITQFVNRRI